MLRESSTYPSVYVAIETLQGFDLCGAVGTEVNSITTIGLDAAELSTAASYKFPSEWQAFSDWFTYESWWTYSGIKLQDRCVLLHTIAISVDNDVY